MSNFTPLVEKEYEWDGDTVKVTFARLKRKDMLLVFPALKELGTARDVQEGDEGVIMVDGVGVKGEDISNAMNDVLDVLLDKLPEYITEFEGLVDSDNQPISVETVASEFYFMRLCSMIVMDMVSESSFKGGKA